MGDLESLSCNRSNLCLNISSLSIQFEFVASAIVVHDFNPTFGSLLLPRSYSLGVEKQ